MKMVRAVVLCLAVIFGDSVFCGMDHPNKDRSLLRGKEYEDHSTRMIKQQTPMAQNPSDYANKAKEISSEQMENLNEEGKFFAGNGNMSPPPIPSSLMQ